MRLFKIGDTVTATTDIWRVDRRTILRAGETAKVRSVSQNTPEGPQIVSLDVKDDIMCDIVCYEGRPLR